jgi:hypothetical protein
VHPHVEIKIVDPVTGVVVGAIPLDAHPEAFQVEQSGSRIFVNLPGTRTLAVVDRKQRKVVAEWSLGQTGGNFPLALAEANHRLFVACRRPACLRVFDTVAATAVDQLDLHGDCDDLFYDAARRRLYASCGEGFIDIFATSDAGRFERVAALKTADGARTSLLAGEILYLAVPHRGRQPAEIRSYHTGP